MSEQIITLSNGYAFDAAKLPVELRPYAYIHMKIDGVVCVKTPNGYAPIPDEAMLDDAILLERGTALTKAMAKPEKPC